MQKHQQAELPSNYSRNFIAKLDGRFLLAKELRANLDAVLADQGGPESLSHVKLALCEKFVWLEAILRGVEKQIAESTDKDEIGVLLSRWIQGLNSLVGLGKCLSLDRKARAVPSLQSYVRERDRR